MIVNFALVLSKNPTHLHEVNLASSLRLEQDLAVVEILFGEGAGRIGTEDAL